MSGVDDYLELVLTDIAHGGASVGRTADGRVVFVRGGIPGERVRVQISQTKKKYVHGYVVDVLEASPHRVTHPWQAGAAGETGAADFGHIDLAWQRELKGRVIRTQIERVGGGAFAQQLADHSVTPVSIDPEGEAAVGVDAGWHTRTRFDVIKMSTGVGMYRERTHELIQLDSMPLAVRDLEELELFGSLWDQAIEPGERLHVVSPASGPNVVVASRTNAIFVRGSVDAVHNVDMNVPNDVHELWTAPDLCLHERASSGQNIYDYDISPDGFWQIHYKAPSALLQRVMAGAEIDAGAHVLELFSGAGLFSVPLAQAIGDAGALLSIEGSDAAVRSAVTNVKSYPWAHARQGWIDAAGVRSALDEIQPSLVVADPPRAGLGIDVAHALASAPSLDRIVLVSCDPASMARDAAEIVSQGWHVDIFHALDIFPHTHHMECVVVLSAR